MHFFQREAVNSCVSPITPNLPGQAYRGVVVMTFAGAA